MITVRLSPANDLPCVTGPYTGVHCRLTLIGSTTRIDPRLRAPAHECCCPPGPEFLAGPNRARRPRHRQVPNWRRSSLPKPSRPPRQRTKWLLTDDTLLGPWTICAPCHGTALRGASNPRFSSPDLRVVAAYSPDTFAQLLRTGVAIGGRNLGVMSTWARNRTLRLRMRRGGTGGPRIRAVPRSAHCPAIRLLPGDRNLDRAEAKWSRSPQRG